MDWLLTEKLPFFLTRRFQQLLTSKGYEVQLFMYLFYQSILVTSILITSQVLFLSGGNQIHALLESVLGCTSWANATAYNSGVSYLRSEIKIVVVGYLKSGRGGCCP